MHTLVVRHLMMALLLLQRNTCGRTAPFQSGPISRSATGWWAWTWNSIQLSLQLKVWMANISYAWTAVNLRLVCIYVVIFYCSIDLNIIKLKHVLSSRSLVFLAKEIAPPLRGDWKTWGRLRKNLKSNKWKKRKKGGERRRPGIKAASQQTLNPPAEVVTNPVPSRERKCAHSPIRVMTMCADRNGVDGLAHRWFIDWWENNMGEH